MGMRKKHHTGPQTAPPDPKGPCEEPDPVEMYCDDFTDTGDVHATNLGDECDPCKVELNLAPKPVDAAPEFLLGHGEGGTVKFPLSSLQPGCYEATFGPIDPAAPSADGTYHFDADGTGKLEVYDAASNCLKPVAAAPGSQVKYTVDGVATTATLDGAGAWVVEPPASNLDPDAALCAVVDAIADPANAAKLDALKDAIDTNTFPTAFSLSVVDGVLTGTVVLNEGDPLVGTATLPDDVSVNAGTYAVDGACQVTLPKSDGSTVTLDLCDLVSDITRVVDPVTGAITFTHDPSGTSWTIDPRNPICLPDGTIRPSTPADVLMSGDINPVVKTDCDQNATRHTFKDGSQFWTSNQQACAKQSFNSIAVEPATAVGTVYSQSACFNIPVAKCGSNITITSFAQYFLEASSEGSASFFPRYSLDGGVTYLSMSTGGVHTVGLLPHTDRYEEAYTAESCVFVPAADGPTASICVAVFLGFNGIDAGLIRVSTQTMDIKYPVCLTC